MTGRGLASEFWGGGGPEGYGVVAVICRRLRPGRGVSSTAPALTENVQSDPVGTEYSLQVCPRLLRRRALGYLHQVTRAYHLAKAALT